MNNLIKLELYKLFKNKLFYVLIIFFMGMSFMINSEKIINLSHQDIINFSIISHINNTFFNGNMLLTLVLIMTTVFVFLDYNKSFIKNIYPSLKNKYTYITSKVICFLVMNFVFLLSIFMVFILSYMIICIKNSFSINLNYIELINYFLNQLLNLTNASTLILLIYLISNNIIVTTVFSLLFSGGAIEQVVSSVLSLINNDNIINLYINKISSYYKLIDFNSFNFNTLVWTVVCILTLIAISSLILTNKKEYI